MRPELAELRRAALDSTSERRRREQPELALRDAERLAARLLAAWPAEPPRQPSMARDELVIVEQAGGEQRELGRTRGSVSLEHAGLILRVAIRGPELEVRVDAIGREWLGRIVAQEVAYTEVQVRLRLAAGRMPGAPEEGL